MGKIFKRGLIALAPVAISIAIILWLFDTLEGIFRIPIEWVVGQYYFRGLGLVVAFLFIFAVGVIVNNLLIQKMTGLLSRLFIRIPLFKTIYGAIGDMMSYFNPKEAEQKGKMVVVEIDSLRFLAILTRESYEGFPPGLGDDDRVTVFIPLSYSIGGFTTTVLKSKVKLIDLPVEQGMRFAVTAGMAGQKGN